MHELILAYEQPENSGHFEYFPRFEDATCEFRVVQKVDPLRVAHADVRVALVDDALLSTKVRQILTYMEMQDYI